MIDDIETCAECNDQFDYSDRYLLTPDGWTCSLFCHKAYFSLTDDLDIT